MHLIFGSMVVLIFGLYVMLCLDFNEGEIYPIKPWKQIKIYPTGKDVGNFF
jgi:hypothetical protein